MTKIYISRIYYFIWLLLIIGCDYPGSSDPKLLLVEPIITDFESKFAPDKRVAIFQIKLDSRNQQLYLEGETNIAEAHKSLLDSINARGIDVQDHIELLPAKSLGSQHYALVNNSVANLRSLPKHSAELATQALLGMPLKVLKQDGDFYLVQAPDDYIAWVDHGGIIRISEEELNLFMRTPKIIYTHTYGFAKEAPYENAANIADLTLGNILVYEDKLDNYFKVKYPDGRIAYVSRNQASLLKDYLANTSPSDQSLITTAKNLLGIPYLWGGTSAKGMDCSGFTKTVYYMQGFILPRDASQQVHSGILIDDQRQFDQLSVGDLLFFGKPETDSTRERVTHVGMWLGNQEFIHSSGKVRISSVDPDASHFDEMNVNRYLKTKRILPNSKADIKTLAIFSSF